MSRVLQRERKLRYKTQEDLASYLGVSARTIARWEAGETRPPQAYQHEIASYFGLPLPAFGWKPKKRRCASVCIVDPAIPTNGALVGREDFLVELQKQLCSPDAPGLFGLTGLPGSGKTAVMQQLVTEIQAEFKGIFWASLGPEPHPLHHLQRWASLLGLDATGLNLTETQNLLRATIGTRRMLLVLDDLSGEQDMEPFLHVGCRLVFTTRQPGLAHVLSKNVLPMPPLSQEDAFALLVADLETHLVKQHQPTLSTLVQRIGGLPGALLRLQAVLRREAAMPSAHRFGETLERLTSHPDPLLWRGVQEQETKLAKAGRTAFHLLAQQFRDTPFTQQEAVAALHQGQVARQELITLWNAGFLEWSEQGYQFPPLLVAYACQANESQQLDDDPGLHDDGVTDAKPLDGSGKPEVSQHIADLGAVPDERPEEASLLSWPVTRNRRAALDRRPRLLRSLNEPEVDRDLGVAPDEGREQAPLEFPWPVTRTHASHLRAALDKRPPLLRSARSLARVALSGHRRGPPASR